MYSVKKNPTQLIVFHIFYRCIHLSEKWDVVEEWCVSVCVELLITREKKSVVVFD